ncbi:CHAP domain-containing protein [Actinoallomurus rhizosphaericola]|nr:CHAP domain-containing protein [Actinoallomurus rhizosphaericola]MCO5995895.1 CHAP domain-containing protein [Actinoallomurus rhizosphaericola]
MAVILLVAAILIGIRLQRSPTADDALKVALSQVGTTEDAAGGSKFNQWFMSSPFAKADVARDGGSIGDYANASWCDMFVTWVGAQAGVKGIGGDAFTPAHARWFERQGRWGTTPKPGAVVFFSWNGGKDIGSIEHVGLVIKDNHDGTIQTVEGNTDNAVKVRTRSKDYVVGYGYPEYSA